ncbi:hypothetical protein H7170_02815 [Candidatus Gracilibacteria bacterium]|nr:hypothetical protein [Candidatus Gracilibacteria bacterium]
MLIRRLLTYSLLSLVALGGFFGNVHIENKKSGVEIASISYERNGVYAALCAAGAASTASAPCESTASADQLKMWNSLIDGLNIILGIITAIVSPAIMFAGWLMSPDWTSGDLFGLRTPMYSLWVTVSNIVYFVYAILLILIALGTMFGKESFSYKVMLPKLALGILMVPFTWWFVQWTISLSAVVTASVITIPAETLGSKDGTSWADTPSIPKDITIDASNGDKPKDKPIVPCSEATCMTPAKFLRDGSGMYGYMMVYAYSIFKFDQVTQIPQGLDILKTGLGIVHQGVVAAIMFLVFGLLTLALVAMLLVRAIKLWVYAIFSPLFTFQFVAGSAMMGDNKDTFTIKEFVGLCFVPAIVGLSLSFGLILINAISSAQPGANTSTCTVPKLKEPAGCELISIMGNTANSISRKIDETDPKNPRTQNIIKFGGVTTTFNGKAGASTDAATLDGVQAFTGVLNSAGGIFGTLIIDIIALVFIWLAFMAAKNVSKAVSMAVEPFEKIGKQVGSLASSIPKYTPIPGLGMSMSGVEKGIGKVEQGYKDHRTNKDAESPLGQLLGLEAARRKETVKAIENIGAQNKNILNERHVKDAVIQAGLEAGKENKKSATTDIANSVLGKFATNVDGKMKVTSSNELLNALKGMNLDKNESDKLIARYNTSGSIDKKFWENGDGDRIYKLIHKNEGSIAATASSPTSPLTINITEYSSVDSIALELKEKSATKEQITEALKGNSKFKDKADEIMEKIKALKEKK